MTQAAAPGASGAIESYSGPDAAAPAAFMPLAPSAAYHYPVHPAHDSCLPGLTVTAMQALTLAARNPAKLPVHAVQW